MVQRGCSTSCISHSPHTTRCLGQRSYISKLYVWMWHPGITAELGHVSRGGVVCVDMVSPYSDMLQSSPCQLNPALHPVLLLSHTPCHCIYLPTHTGVCVLLCCRAGGRPGGSLRPEVQQHTHHSSNNQLLLPHVCLAVTSPSPPPPSPHPVLHPVLLLHLYIHPPSPPTLNPPGVCHYTVQLPWSTPHPWPAPLLPPSPPPPHTYPQVFVSYYVVELEGGQEAADDLIARLANDHAAVADGDALRLYTCAFVSDSLQALIFGLVGM